MPSPHISSYVSTVDLGSVHGLVVSGHFHSCPLHSGPSCFPHCIHCDRVEVHIHIGSCPISGRGGGGDRICWWFTPSSQFHVCSCLYTVLSSRPLQTCPFTLLFCPCHSPQLTGFCRSKLSRLHTCRTDLRVHSRALLSPFHGPSDLSYSYVTPHSFKTRSFLPGSFTSVHRGVARKWKRGWCKLG